MTTTVSANATYYENLLHSLQHEHTRNNFDRHVLVVEKWCRTFSEGVLICDLLDVVALLKILRERLTSHAELFEPAFIQVLEVCSKALLESKSNERLRPDKIANIKTYFFELSLFIPLGSLSMRTACIRAFQRVIRAGIDPSLAQDGAPQSSPKQSSAVQVRDTLYIQSLLRDSGALTIIAAELFSAYSDYSAKMSDLRETSFSLTQALNKQNKSRADLSNLNEEEGDEKSVASINDDSSIMQKSDRLKVVTSDALDYAVSVLALCLELSADFSSAALLCQEGLVCNALVLALKEETLSARPDSGRISQATELLWNCVESYVHFMKQEESAPAQDSVPAAIKQLIYSGKPIVDFRSAVFTLRAVFRQMLFNCYRQSDRETRNEVLIVLTLLLNFPQAVPYVISCGLLNDVVSFGTVGDAGHKAWPFYSRPLPKLRNFVTVADIDLQLKKQLWLVTGDLLMSDDADVITCVAASPFLSTLFSYLEQSSLEDDASVASRTTEDPPLLEEEDHQQAASPVEKQNTPPVLEALPVTQLREFQVLAMTILAANAHRMMAEFLRINGPTRSLDVLCKYSKSPHPEHKSLVYHTFLLLNRNVMQSNVVNSRLEQHDAIRVFLHFFEFSDDEAARAQSARIITVMCCKSVESQQQLRQIRGIAPLVNALKAHAERRNAVVGKSAGVSFSSLSGETDKDTTSGHDENGGEMNVFLISVLDCIRNAILGNQKSEAVFAQKEGVDALLDVLEVSPFIHRSVILRLISDLFDNRKLVSYAYAWRSHKTMRSVGQLLAHCWMDEEARIGCLRDKEGVICNLWDALGDHTWPAAALEKKTASSLSPQLSVTSTQSGAEVKSSTVARLNTAILAARVGVSGASLHVLRQKALESDLRCVLASVFQLLGFLAKHNLVAVEGKREDDGEPTVQGFLRALALAGEGAGLSKSLSAEEVADQNLSPTDRQVISVAARYDVLREGQWWREIAESLAARNVVPVEEDLNLVDFLNERVFAAARAIQFEQMELGVVRLHDKRSEEEVFFNHIIQQKNQQIKSEYLKRKSGRK